MRRRQFITALAALPVVAAAAPLLDENPYAGFVVRLEPEFVVEEHVFLTSRRPPKIG